MRRASFALLLVLSACSGSTSTPIAPSSPAPGVNLSGSWTLQTQASGSCSGLSADAVSHSYSRVTIYYASYDTITITVGINGVTLPILTDAQYYSSVTGFKIQERVRLTDNSVVGGLAIDGTFTSSVINQNKIAGTLNGNFTNGTADCAAADHTLTFTR